MPDARDALIAFLTKDELTLLTGSPIARLQVLELKRRGYVFELDRRGRPVVSRAYAEERLGSQAERGQPAIPKTPRFDRIRAVR